MTVTQGAPHYGTGGTDRGAVYVYVRPPGGWASTAAYAARLTAGDGVDGDEFGAAVALSSGGHTVVAGVPYSDAGGLDRGAAYVYAQLPKHFVFLPPLVRNPP
ncbi:MAG: FG-GAP repeat protein [Anaerolineae bacterium]